VPWDYPEHAQDIPCELVAQKQKQIAHGKLLASNAILFFFNFSLYLEIKLPLFLQFAALEFKIDPNFM